MDEAGATDVTRERARLTRREALRRGAVFGGATLWAAPMVQTISMSQALAQTGTPLPLRCGRMTGGGSVLTDDYGRVTHGFELHCAPGVEPNRLEVSWRVGGVASTFLLDTLTASACRNDPAFTASPPGADFDTFVGAGSGRLREGRGPFADGYTIDFTFTDAGEPGVADRARIVITDPAGNVVLDVDGRLEFGNQQAHAATGSKAC